MASPTEERPRITVTRNPYGWSLRIEHEDPYTRFKAPHPADVRRAVREADQRYERALRDQAR